MDFAILHNRITLAKVLINSRFDVNEKWGISRNYSPLQKAISFPKGSIEMATILLDAGADIEVKNDLGLNLFIFACYLEKYEMAAFLLKKRPAFLNEGDEISELKAIHLACELGSLKFLQLLIDNDVDFNVTSYYGKTALHYAAENGSVEICQILLKHCPNLINSCDAIGCNALSCAFIKHSEKKDPKYIAVIKFLIENGAVVPKEYKEENYITFSSSPLPSPQATYH